MATTEELMTIPYSEFVAGLFIKPADVPGKLAHAAVGLVGELLELRVAGSREEALEELGDLEFYVEAAWQQFAPARGIGLIRHFPNSQAAAQYVAEQATGLILDLSKKVWIYGKPLEGDTLAGLACSLQTVSYCLNVIKDHLGFTPEEVEAYNREKLIKRYPGASYTDAAAQARADKEAPRQELPLVQAVRQAQARVSEAVVIVELVRKGLVP